MAGDKLYLGQILGQLKQDTQDYSATLQTMITELKNVKMAVTSNITEVNVRASDNLKVAPTHTERRVAQTVKDDYNLLQFHCLARGTIRIQFNWFWTDSSSTVGTIFIKVGSNVVALKESRSALLTFDVPVNSGECVTIGTRCNGSGQGTGGVYANTLKVFYDIIDIVNSPAVSVVNVF